MARLEDLRKRVENALSGSGDLKGMSSQILLEMTGDGLRIQIVDADQRPMFASGSATVQPYMRDLLRAMGKLLAEVPNRLTLEGHTDALPFGSGERGYSNWELSADRANASRRELLAGGLPEEQVLRVQGMASVNPIDRKDPTGPSNRRISLIVMTREAEDRVFRATPPQNTEDLNVLPVPGLPPTAAPASPTPAQAASSPTPVHR